MLDKLFYIIAVVNGVCIAGTLLAFYVSFFVGLVEAPTKTIEEIKAHNVKLYRIIFIIVLMLTIEIIIGLFLR